MALGAGPVPPFDGFQKVQSGANGEHFRRRAGFYRVAKWPTATPTMGHMIRNVPENWSEFCGRVCSCTNGTNLRITSLIEVNLIN